jgi:hypothetical protein
MVVLAVLQSIWGSTEDESNGRDVRADEIDLSETEGMLLEGLLNFVQFDEVKPVLRHFNCHIDTEMAA